MGLRREIEAAVGCALLKKLSQRAIKKNGLTESTVQLKTGLQIRYIHRGTIDARKTILMLHGITADAVQMVEFVSEMDIPIDVRLVMPDQLGHGKDRIRAKRNPETFVYPTSDSMVKTIEQFIEALQIQSCDIIGYSMGGAIAYVLRQLHPEIINKSVLVSPGIQSCTSQSYVNDIANGGKANHCFETRSDLNEFIRKTSTPDLTKKNLLPKMFLEPIVRERQRNTPPQYFEKMTQSLRETLTKQESKFYNAQVAERDIDPNTDRLVIWPDQDQICTYSRGKDFFSESIATKFVTLENCGHIFDKDGQTIYGKAAPQITAYLFDRK